MLHAKIVPFGGGNTSVGYVSYAHHAGAGFGNMLQAFQIAFVIAVMTNRTLIAMPFEQQHVGGDPHPYTKYLEVIDGWPVVLSSDFKDLTPMMRNSQTVDLSPFSRDVNLTSLVRRYQSSSALLLRYGASWGMWETMFQAEDQPAILAVLQRHVRFAPGIREAARKLEESLPKPYNTIHFRLGDKPYGLALLNCSSEDLNWNGPLGCSGGTIEFAASRWQASRPAYVYVATDEPTSPRVQNLLAWLRLRGIRSGTWEDLDQNVSGLALEEATSGVSMKELTALMTRDGTFISCIEQQLAISANRHLPTFPSSWDSYVIEARYMAGRRDATSQFAAMIENQARLNRYLSRTLPNSSSGVDKEQAADGAQPTAAAGENATDGPRIVRPWGAYTSA